MQFYTDGTIIRDEKGRHRIFKGINVCIKTKECSAHHFRKMYCTKKHFDLLKSYGFNIIRLGISWDMIEPMESEYSMDFIEAFQEYIALCGENDIYVMLDMHQDLFSHFLCDVGDGAPQWALSKDLPLHQKPYAIWAEGYFYMDNVQKAFHDFWQNENAIQEKYIEMWCFYAKQFADFPNVIAYDYMNEPYVEKDGRTIFMTIVQRVLYKSLQKELNPFPYFQKYGNKKAFRKTFFTLVKKVKTIRNLKKMASVMDNTENFGTVIAGLESYTQPFNENFYAPFIQDISNRVNPTNTIFNVIEHNYFSNLGIPFSINAPKNCLYSPHAYDVFVDSPLYNKYSSNQRIQYITSQIRKNQEKMNLPVLFGEWGAGANGTEWIKHIDYVYGIMEKNLWSQVYWGFVPHEHKLRSMYNRPSPIAINGPMLSYQTDNKTKTFSMDWECDEKSEDNLIYMPGQDVISISAHAGKNHYVCTYSSEQTK